MNELLGCLSFGIAIVSYSYTFASAIIIDACNGLSCSLYHGVLVVRPVVPSVATQLKSDGHTHAVVTIYPTADNLGCKK